MIDRFASFGASARSRTVLKAGVAVLAVAVATPALAQAAPAAASDVIVVTGYAHSIQNAIKAKKVSSSIMESISSEDVGKLPDVSIADALSRLPGLAVQQEAGRAAFLSIGGFGPDFTTATLNGRIVASADDNRRFDFGLFPGDLFEQINVSKTPTADLINYGLAGDVDLKTYDPLTHKKTLSINIQGQVGQYGALNPESSNKGYKATLIYTNKFANDTIGLSFGLSALKDPEQNYNFATGGSGGNWGVVSATDASSYRNSAPASSLGNAAGAIAPTDLQNYVRSNILTRKTGFGHLVYRPDDKFEMAVDGFYTKSQTREYARGWEMPIPYGWSQDLASSTTPMVAANGVLQSATWSVFPVLRNNFNTSDAETYGFGWNAKYRLTDNIKLKLDANLSHAHRHDNSYEIYMGTASNGVPGMGATANITRQADGAYAVNITGNTNFASASQVSLTDPQGWGQVGFNNVPDVTDTVKGLKAELQGDLHGGFFKNWEVGVNYNDEKKVSAYSGYFLCLPGATGTTDCGGYAGDTAQQTSVAIPSSIVTGAVSPYGVTGTQILALNPLAAQALLKIVPQSVTSDVSRDWTVEEKVLTGYLQVNFDTIAGSLPFKGNVGLQVVNTDQASMGNAALSATSYAATNFDSKYTYVLPSASASLEVDHNTFVKLGASRTLARARLGDENGSFSVGYCNTGCTNVTVNGKTPVFNGNGGNPYLRPYFSDNVDLSLEKYFAHDQGKIAVHGFYKFISNYVGQNTSYLADFSAFSGQDSAGLLTGSKSSQYTTLGLASGPENNGKGYVDGVDVSLILPFTILSPSLNGLGVSGNFAYTDSAINFTGISTPITLPGLSKSVAQAVVWYEMSGFNARASFTHRSAYLGDYQLFSAQLTSNETKSQDTLDAQIGYDFKSGSLKGLSLYIQGHNLTNSKTITYVGVNGGPANPAAVNVRSQYGAQYLAGATFKF